MTKMSKSEAKGHLRRSLEEIPELRGMNKSSQEFTEWKRNAGKAIEYAFGENSSQIKEFNLIRYIPNGIVRGYEQSGIYATAYQSGLDQATPILKSMIDEIDRFWPDDQPTSPPAQSETTNRQIDSKKVFVVHGRDEGTLSMVVRTLERLDLAPIVLQEQSSEGRTIIEKFEDHAGDVGFAIVLCTPDDEGRLRGEQDIKPRPRQNVVFEWGFFTGQIGRGRVVALVKDDVEIPSDYSGVIYIPLDEQGGWKMRLVKELSSAGFQVDANRLL